jgi:hypothetical protein
MIRVLLLIINKDGVLLMRCVEEYCIWSLAH